MFLINRVRISYLNTSMDWIDWMSCGRAFHAEEPVTFLLRLKDEVLGEVPWGMTINDFPHENTIAIMVALANAQK